MSSGRTNWMRVLVPLDLMCKDMIDLRDVSRRFVLRQRLGQLAGVIPARHTGRAQGTRACHSLDTSGECATNLPCRARPTGDWRALVEPAMSPGPGTPLASGSTTLAYAGNLPRGGFA